MSGCWSEGTAWQSGTGRFGENTSRGKPAPRLEIRTEPNHVQDGRGLKFLSLQRGEWMEAQASPQM